MVGGSSSLTFNFELPPGDHTVDVIVGEERSSQQISVKGANVAVEIADYRLKRGGTVEMDLRISNHGELSADDVLLTGTWLNRDNETDPTETTQLELVQIEAARTINLTLPIELAAGSYDFELSVATSTVEGEKSDNTAMISLDIEFVDLRVSVASTESLGWDENGRALMSLFINVENAGLDDSDSFSVGLECGTETPESCSTATQFQPIAAGDAAVNEMRVWLPIGEATTRIFAAENETTFRWGEMNAIDHRIDVPTAPELVWDLRRISTPEVLTYWSDGSANVDFELTFVNNGTDAAQTVDIECLDGDAIVEDCGAKFSIAKEVDVYPTVIKQTLRLPQGDIDLRFQYGAESTQSATANVPKRIIGVERDVWECFSDTSFVELREKNDNHDEGIGCGGWKNEFIIKWPVGETINVWVTGEQRHKDIFEEVLDELGPYLNLEFEYVANKSDAHIQVYAGWDKGDAVTTGLNCVEFGGCARRWLDNHSITQAKIAIWDSEDIDDTRRDQWIRAASLHELLHALTGIQHRHHDRTSVMSYDALDYTAIDGIDEGLFQLLAHPLVRPGMSFDEVLDLIIFSDELNDTPEPAQLSAQELLRRAAATMIDAGSVRFEMKGDWPRCGGNHDFGPATHQIGNLKYGRDHWLHFAYGRENYIIITDPDDPYDFDDGKLIEYWINRGSRWERVNSDRFYNADSNFRDYWSNPMDMLSHINIWEKPSNYNLVRRTSNLAVLEISLDGPSPDWSRGVDVDIRIEMHPETFAISEYEMTWRFDPRNRDVCDTYKVEARKGVYGLDFKFPDEIIEGSSLLD